MTIVVKDMGWVYFDFGHSIVRQIIPWLSRIVWVTGHDGRTSKIMVKPTMVPENYSLHAKISSNLESQYRVTIHVVLILPLTPKQRFCLITWASC